jgi:hypothetical protein
MVHFQDQIKVQLDGTWQMVQENIMQSSHVLDQKTQSHLDRTFMERLATQQNKIEQQASELPDCRMPVPHSRIFQSSTSFPFEFIALSLLEPTTTSKA